MRFESANLGLRRKDRGRIGPLRMMKPLNAPSARTCRQYDPTFQLEAIRSWLGGGKSVEVVAQELGLSPGVLDHCLRAAPSGRTPCRKAAGVGR